MTTAQRAYINKRHNQYVDDECLEYRSVPMAVVNTILKVKHPVSDFTGVKRVFNNIPARPKNLNALATTIARMNGMDYSKVASLSMKIAQEERTAVTQFVKNNKDPFEEITGFTPQKYVPEQPTQSTTGVRLSPGSIKDIKEMQKNVGPLQLTPMSQQLEIDLLMGDESMTYNTPPMTTTGIEKAAQKEYNRVMGIDRFVDVPRSGPRTNPRLPTPVKGEFFDPPPAYSTRSRSPGGPATKMMAEPEREISRMRQVTANYERASSSSDRAADILYQRMFPGKPLPVERGIDIPHSNRDSVFGKHFTKE